MGCNESKPAENKDESKGDAAKSTESPANGGGDNGGGNGNGGGATAFKWADVSAYGDDWWNGGDALTNASTIPADFTSKAGLGWFGTHADVTASNIEGQSKAVKQAIFDKLFKEDAAKENLIDLVKNHTTDGFKFGLITYGIDEQSAKDKWVDAIQDLLTLDKDHMIDDGLGGNRKKRAKNVDTYFKWIRDIEVGVFGEDEAATEQAKLALFTAVLEDETTCGSADVSAEDAILKLISYRFDMQDNEFRDLGNDVDAICARLFDDQVAADDSLYDDFIALFA